MPDTLEGGPDQRPQSSDNGAPPARQQHEAISPERLQEARSVYRSYYHWLRLSRFAMAAFLALALFFFAWLTPWLPRGFDARDYTPEISFTVYLLSGITFLGIVTLALRERAWRKRETLMAWSAVYDEGTGLHHRTYLYDRLSLECERAERANSSFSVLIMHIRLGGAQSGPMPTLSHTALQRLAELINGLTHPGDLVALLSGSELAVLAIEVNRDDRSKLLERLRLAIMDELPHLINPDAIVGVAAGSATYGTDGRDPETLIKTARTSAAFGSPVRHVAA
jgi:diguanylate cyclase (GGDEF)-like protein